MFGMFKKSQQNTFDDNKSNELIDAAIQGNLAVFESLIQSGADTNYIDEYGDTALSQAAFEGHLEVVKKLLKLSPSIYSKNRAILLAAQSGYEDIIICLIEGGADVNTYMEGYHTPLLQTIVHNRIGAFNRLLIAPGIELDKEDEEGEIPILVAALNGRLEMVQSLVNNGANHSITNIEGQSAHDMAIRNNKQDVLHYLEALPSRRP